MAESIKPVAWLFRFDNGTYHYESDPNTAADIMSKLDVNETATELFTAAQLEQARREEREKKIAWPPEDLDTQ